MKINSIISLRKIVGVLFIIMLALPLDVLFAQSTFYRQGMNNDALWKAMEMKHKKDKATGSYTYKSFIYLANGQWPELDAPVIAALQAELPAGKEVMVIKGEVDPEKVRKDYPDAHVFFFVVRTATMQSINVRTGLADSWSSRTSLDFKMQDESGTCDAIEVNHLICFPADIIAKILVKNILQIHLATGVFMDEAHKDHFKDSQNQFLDDIRSLKEKEIIVGESDLNMPSTELAAAYPGKIIVVGKADVYNHIRNGSDTYILLAPDDDCRQKIEDTRVTNVKVLYHCATGKCFIGRFPNARKTFEGFGFVKADFEWLQNPKL